MHLKFILFDGMKTLQLIIMKCSRLYSMDWVIYMDLLHLGDQFDPRKL